MNRFDEALPPLKKALDVDPDNVNSYVQLGRVYHANKNYPDGRSVSRKPSKSIRLTR